MAFTKKNITLEFTLGGSQTFAGTKSNRVTVSGLRVSCKIVKGAAPSMNQCELQIFGLTPTIYNALTSVYNVTQAIVQNQVTVFAGDTDSNIPRIFIGQITVAQINLNQPDAIMTIIAQTAQLSAITPISSTVFPGSFDVATAMQSLAIAMQMSFENNGVNVQLAGMKLDGTARDQAMKLAQAANITIGFDDQTLAIMPKNGSRSQNQKTVLIAPETGMIGYPNYGTNGIALKTLYNPAADVKWQAQIQVKSSLQVANLNGLWIVNGITHTLESELPNGRWDTEIQAYNFNAIGP